MLSFATLLLLSYAAFAQSSPAIQVVTVGEGGQLRYNPDTITAAVGSQVEFQYFGPAHSVVQADFNTPCSPFNNGAGFFAGMQTTGTGPNVSVLSTKATRFQSNNCLQPLTFTITINDTKPIWFYCAFPSHCQAGMVGVINPS
jgi:plastocyanin